MAQPYGDAIVSQLDPARRNVVEFRHVSWWNEDVYRAIREAGIIFCSCSGPRLPDELIRTADEVYVRLHGPKRWYRHDYSKSELESWANRIRGSGATRAWAYFNNDNDAYAPKTRQSCGACWDDRLPASEGPKNFACIANVQRAAWINGGPQEALGISRRCGICPLQ
jgi:uncharacterized protein YecE (DUF72 family)